MIRYINQAKHNQTLLDFLETTSPNDYFDWKCTFVFYKALHLLRAYAAFKGVTIAQSHIAVFNAIDTRNAASALMVSADFYNAYYDLYQISRRTRYSGFVNKAFDFQLFRSYFEVAKSDLLIVEKFLINEGLNF